MTGIFLKIYRFILGVPSVNKKFYDNIRRGARWSNLYFRKSDFGAYMVKF